MVPGTLSAIMNTFNVEKMPGKLHVLTFRPGY
jgi:hypothetical protein